jgi:hypothetical protein
VYLVDRRASVVGKGHTLDGENVKEEDQPPVVGWCVNFRVGPYRNSRKKALYGDLYIRKEHDDAIREYPGRSIELYPDSGEVPHIALLKKVPERNLPVIKFSADSDRDRYFYSLRTPDSQLPLHYSKDPLSMNDDDLNSAIGSAVAGETKSAKGTDAKLDEILGMMKQFISLVMQADPNEDGDSLLAPADGDRDPADAAPAKPEPKKSDDKDKKDEEPPVKMGAECASANNVYPADTNDKKDKVKMSRETEEALKFQKMQNEALAKRCEEFAFKFNRMKAEKTVADWEQTHFIEFPSEAMRQAEIEMLASLDDQSFEVHQKRALLLYKKKKPAGEAVRELSKFARTAESEKGPLQSTDDVAAFISALDSGRLGGNYEEALAKFSGKRTS